VATIGAIPEPSTIVLVAMAVGGMMIFVVIGRTGFQRTKLARL
jgi:hypothetical protein